MKLAIEPFERAIAIQTCVGQGNHVPGDARSRIVDGCFQTLYPRQRTIALAQCGFGLSDFGIEKRVIRRRPSGGQLVLCDRFTIPSHRVQDTAESHERRHALRIQLTRAIDLRDGRVEFAPEVIRGGGVVGHARRQRIDGARGGELLERVVESRTRDQEVGVEVMRCDKTGIQVDGPLKFAFRGGELTDEIQVEMAKALGCDTLRYLPVDSIARAIQLPADNLCRACITGRYPTPHGQQLYQIALANAQAGAPAAATGSRPVRTYETPGARR